MKVYCLNITYTIVLLCALSLATGNVSAHIADADKPEPLAAFSEPTPSHYAITGVRLVDPRSETVIPNAFVEVADGHFVSLGPMESSDFPSGLTRIDATGQTLIPGLILVHEHLFYADHPEPFYIVRNQPVAFPRMYLASGITTMRTGGSVEPYTDLALARGVLAGTVAGPEILLTTPLVTEVGDPVFQAVVFDNPEDVRGFIDYWAGLGFTSVKLYMNATPALVRSTIEAAHEQGMQVTGHLCATSYAEAAEAGIDDLEHGFGVTTDFVPGREPNTCKQADASSLAAMNPEGPNESRLIATLIEHGVALTSTLAVFESFSAGLPELDPLSNSLLSPDGRALYKARKAVADASPETNAWGSALKSMQAMEVAFYRDGGRLVAGTDPTGVGRVLPGPGSIRTLELLQEAGLTPMEVLRIASSDAAEFLGIETRTGTLAPGMEADFVLIDGEPDRNIAELRKVRSVYSNGRAFSSKKLYDSVGALVGGNRWHVPDSNAPTKN